MFFHLNLNIIKGTNAKKLFEVNQKGIFFIFGKLLNLLLVCSIIHISPLSIQQKFWL